MVGETFRDRLRKVRAQVLYNLEMECRRQGWGADPAFVHDEERELFRFHDGRFAFSCEHADWALLRKRGRLRGWEYGSNPPRGLRDLPPQDPPPRDQSRTQEQHEQTTAQDESQRAQRHQRGGPARVRQGRGLGRV